MKVTGEDIRLDSREDSLKNELDRRLSAFEFEQGAVLIQVPQVPLDLLEREVANRGGYFAYPPQGLLYLSAIFRSLGIETRIVDLNFVVLREAQKENADVERAWKEAVDELLYVLPNSFICVSFMFSSTYPYFKQICEYVRLRKPGVCIWAGGVNATAEVEKILTEKLTDFVFSYEGELSLKSFYAYLRRESSELPLNISFLDSCNSVVHTAKLPMGDINVDIRDEYCLIPINEYHKVGSLSNYSRMNGAQVPFATINSRRGCRGHCRFCSTGSFYGKGVRVRDVEGVINEMEVLYHKYGIRHFDWLDDDLLFDEKKVLTMFEQMALRLPDITWAANNGVLIISVTPEIMRAMEKSGCIGFKIGLESGNESILHKMCKPVTLEKFFSFSEMAQEFPRIFVVVNLILGIPGEMFAQMFDSFKATLRGKLDWNSFFIFQLIKNTDFYAAYGEMRDKPMNIDKSNLAQGPVFNPVRDGAFKNYQIPKDLFSGYDIIDIDRDLVPGKDQLTEIWFTFTYIANFIRLPALFTKSEIRLKNAICWMDALLQAYPDNAAMSCVLYYLKHRLSEGSPRVLEEIRRDALLKIKRSKYWQFRDQQFNFSSFLDRVIPEVDSRYLRYLQY